MATTFFSSRHRREFNIIDVRNQSVFDFVTPILNDPKYKYKVKSNLAYYSKRYDKWITVKAGDKSDGATSAPDIDSWCWLIHDDLCNFGVFEDGSKCTNWQASMILSDILREEKRYLRSLTWFTGTWLFGGGKARDNGMF